MAADQHAAPKNEPGSHGSHGAAASHGGGGGHAHEEHEEHEGAPEWLISFADNVTLMMGFFVILLAMNMKPASSGGAGEQGQGGGGAATSSEMSPEMLDMAIAIREAFNNPVDLNSTKPGELPLINRILQRRGNRGYSEDEGPSGKHEQAQSLNRGDMRKASARIVFAQNSSQLTTQGMDQIRATWAYFRGIKLVLEIRGHTSAEEAYHSDDRGTGLSFARAQSVAQALTQLGLDWRQMRLVACGANEPEPKAMDNAENAARSARVEVIVTDEVMTE